MAERDPRRRQCGVAAFADTLDPAERAELEDCFADRTMKTAAIARVLIRRGLQRRPDAVRKHRVGECSCGELS